MLQILLFEIILLSIVFLIIFYVAKKHKTNEEHFNVRFSLLQIIKRAIFIFAASMIFGGLFADIFTFFGKLQTESDLSSGIADFFGTWFFYTLYGTLYSSLPAFLMLIPGLYFTLNSKVKLSKKIILNLALGLSISIVVIFVNFLIFRQYNLIWLEIPFLFAGVLSCMLVPKFFGDYEFNQ
jgi:hypothetical protein